MTIGKRLPASKDHRPDSQQDVRAKGQSLPPSVDGFRSAGRLVGAAAVIVAFCLMTVALDGIRGTLSRPDAGAALYRTIGLSELALVPAGHPARRPGSFPMFTDGRYLPTLPRGNPGVVPLMDADRLAAPGKAAP
jgi:hypothetical protein